jgi:hypothetical protein
MMQKGAAASNRGVCIKWVNSIAYIDRYRLVLLILYLFITMTVITITSDVTDRFTSETDHLLSGAEGSTSCGESNKGFYTWYSFVLY